MEKNQAEKSQDQSKEDFEFVVGEGHQSSICGGVNTTKILNNENEKELTKDED